MPFLIFMVVLAIGNWTGLLHRFLAEETAKLLRYAGGTRTHNGAALVALTHHVLAHRSLWGSHRGLDWSLEQPLHALNEADITVPGKATLAPGAVPAISASLAGSASIHVGLVGVLRGDVVGDGSFGAPSAQDLDVTQPGYFQQLAIDTGLNLTQFGIYPGS